MKKLAAEHHAPLFNLLSYLKHPPEEEGFEITEKWETQMISHLFSQFSNLKRKNMEGSISLIVIVSGLFAFLILSSFAGIIMKILTELRKWTNLLLFILLMIAIVIISIAFSLQ